MRNLLLFAILVFLSINVSDAYAYLDPGSGSVLIQAIIGALAISITW